MSIEYTQTLMNQAVCHQVARSLAEEDYAFYKPMDYNPMTIEELMDSLSKWCASDTAYNRDVLNWPLRSPLGQQAVLIRNLLVVESFFYYVADHVDGEPVRVNSMYRSPRLNRLVGGASRSAHMSGRAVDIQLPFHNFEVLQNFVAYLSDQMAANYMSDCGSVTHIKGYGGTSFHIAFSPSKDN